MVKVRHWFHPSPEVVLYFLLSGSLLHRWFDHTCIGSHFSSGMELHYLAVEGWLLGLGRALEKTLFCTLGCPDLHLYTDHEQSNLDNVKNPCLLCMLERMFMWWLSLKHVPGKKIGVHPMILGVRKMKIIDSFKHVEVGLVELSWINISCGVLSLLQFELR